MKRNKKIKIVVLICLSLIMPFVIRNVKADTSYPVLVFDTLPPTDVGKKFIVIFTCFSDSNENISVQIWVDDIVLVWEANQVYYLNQEVTISTTGLLPGEGHTLKVIATDYLSRSNELNAQFAVDNVDPFFNYLEVSPDENDVHNINENTPVTVKWSANETNFREICLYKDGGLWKSSGDKIGEMNTPEIDAEDPFDFELKIIISDTAGNTATRIFTIHYLVEEVPEIPVDEHEAKMEEERIKSLKEKIGFGLSPLIILGVFGGFQILGRNQKKKEDA